MDGAGFHMRFLVMVEKRLIDIVKNITMILYIYNYIINYTSG